MQLSHEQVKAIMTRRPNLDGILWVHRAVHADRKARHVSDLVNAIGAFIAAAERLHTADRENGDTKLADLFGKHCTNHTDMDPWTETASGGTHQSFLKIVKTVGEVHGYCEKALAFEPGIQALKDEMLDQFTIDFKEGLPKPKKTPIDDILDLLKDLDPGKKQG